MDWLSAEQATTALTFFTLGLSLGIALMTLVRALRREAQGRHAESGLRKLQKSTGRHHAPSRRVPGQRPTPGSFQ
ncbi:hypothetical protein ACFVH6_04210 [Spirillospora sp. NPDC127200]